MGQNLVTLCPADFYEEKGFEDTYEIDESNFLGTGKFAVVHLCWRRNQPEKRYALKVINTKIGDMASINRIHEEINILTVIGHHPGLVSLVDVDEGMPGSIRLVLELCEGGELYDRIQQKQYYTEQEARTCTHNLLEAVAYIHSKGIMHRDLKPENILLASKVSNTDVKISDFGLARMSRDFPNRLPRSHSICGSDFYLAPEVIKQEEYGREIDIWAVGIITYVLLSGSLPFFHNVLHKLYRQIVERDMSFPEAAWKNVSKGALDFILRLLQVRAGDRLTAEQGVSHPWLRGVSAGSSFGSFENQQVARIDSRSTPNYHALEHAHNVGGSKGQEQRPGTPAGRVQGGAASYGQQNPYGHGPMPAMSRGAVQGPPQGIQAGRGGY
jgi:serine/threonine protein kinase